MNELALRRAEAAFLSRYPGGFAHPELVEIGQKKHKMDKMEALTRESFAKKRFDDPARLAEDAIRVVSRSSMVSVFEKPKFRDYVRQLGRDDRAAFVAALQEWIHGAEARGFEALFAALAPGKLTKWTLMSVFKAYYRPRHDVFIKPTTAKLIIARLELGLEYHPTPTWGFYRDFRNAINDMKQLVAPELAINNPAFCGFLMMTLSVDLN